MTTSLVSSIPNRAVSAQGGSMDANETIGLNRDGMQGAASRDGRTERGNAPTKVMRTGAASETLASPDVLDELKAAHVIIRNALNIMTPSQRVEWAQRNKRDGVIGEGTTRANERDVAITRAGGA